jgi:membrane-associated phospholipid phosphatase
MASGEPDDFEAIPLGGTAKLANPQGGFAFGYCGVDAHAATIAAAPRFSSAETAAEMVELYWAALTHDVPYDAFASDPTIAAAAADLSTMVDFRGPRSRGLVTPSTIFRGQTAGDLSGPYISQLLWKPVNYGPYVVDQKVRVTAPGVEFLTDYNEWLAIQNGGAPRPQQFIGTDRRYIITPRDLAEWLHRDFPFQAGLNAAFILLASGVGLAPGNPYLNSATQVGGPTFGLFQILDLIASSANLSLQACWFHKWSVHRRVRPEEFAGSLRNKLVLGLQRPIHRQLLDSAALRMVLSRHGSALLPMPYPEGCPTHSAYPAGHATFAGACATMLKAFFNANAAMTNTVVPNADGSALVPYTATPLTAGNEIDKLASNVAIGRVPAGVHWRSDSVQGMLLGEQCAIAVLQDMRRTWNESFVGFSVKKFDGTTVTI